MNEETILKLLNSTNEQDILIAISMIAELEDPRAFFRKHGEVLPGQSDHIDYTNLGQRYKIELKTSNDTSYYYKMKEDLYIVRTDLTTYIAECYQNYDKSLKVINH